MRMAIDCLDLDSDLQKLLFAVLDEKEEANDPKD